MINVYGFFEKEFEFSENINVKIILGSKINESAYVNGQKQKIKIYLIKNLFMAKGIFLRIDLMKKLMNEN